MAINSLDVPCDKSTPKYPASTNSSCIGAGLSSCRLVKINFATEGSIISSTGSKRSRKKNPNSKSPYLDGDNLHLHSQVTEKTVIHKKATTEYVSSYPMAVNLYKASSDEFNRLKKATKKAKKSVLTLPNAAPTLQACTVSDMNDSEYFNETESRKKIKKRNVPPRTRKPRISRDFEFYDRDARYCSQMNINLDCSSTDIIQSKRGHDNFDAALNPNEKKPSPHDVWEILRNINRFQFNPSPPMSDESFKATPKRKAGRRQNNQKDTRVVETCRTEEFAYISSYEVGSSHSLSKSSSLSIETVIDTQEDLSKFCDDFVKKIKQTKHLPQTINNKSQIKNQYNKPVANRNISKPLTKALNQKTNKQKGLPIEYPKKQNYNCGDTKQIGVQGDTVSSLAYNNMNDAFDSFSSEAYETQILKEIDDGLNSEHNLAFTGDSGTSKVALNNEFYGSGASSGFDTFFSNQINNPLNGITKVVLSKGPSKPSIKKVEHVKPIRKVSLPPNQPPKFNFSTLIPKLTQTEIRRRLAKLKFPIVILGKDELSSSYVVNNSESMQFNGLNDKMWSFMEEWQNDGSVQHTKVKAKTDVPMKKKHNPEIFENNRTVKLHKKLIPATQANTEKKTNGLKSINKCKEEPKHIASPAELLNSVQPKKTKPIRQFKEKMLKLLYKNSSILSIDNKKDNTGEYLTRNTTHLDKATTVKVDACTDTSKPKCPQGASRNLINSPVSKQVTAVKQPWAKARWASDFIDNVIKKIKNGVYYTHDSKLSHKKQYLQCKEAEIQTIATQSEPITMQSISKITVKKKEVVIPGFDNNTLPALEIHAMNMNQISVKHCVTNIMVHFDVTVPNEPVISLQKSPSLIPLKVSESQTKIFKCKTSIINAMLPAELCSILPNMWNVLESGKARALPSAPAAKPIHLTNIPEITSISTLRRPTPLCLQMTMTPALQKIINGVFSKTRPPYVPKQFVAIHYNRILAEQLLSRLSIHHILDCKADVQTSINYKCTSAPNLSNPVDNDISKQLDSCMKLEPYTASNKTLIPSFMCNDLSSILRRMRSYLTENISPYSRVLNYFIDKNITISLTMTNSQGLKDTLSIDLSRFVNGNCVKVLEASKDKCNTLDNEHLPKFQHEKLKAQSNMNLLSSSIKTKRKGFIKLYRKCKSTSNLISGDKTTTSISKITNLNEFFKALGTAKLLCGVFDNAFAYKILTSLKEMRCWISDINPTQALLVFLLTNKKETANLLRYRPVLLQGIAVSRITRANELDMEIEVIEKENLNRLHQASDYQRTFDASSEKLLKSLLEKRKKLNPSYLRVMARYVGLGLLKTPVKK